MASEVPYLLTPHQIDTLYNLVDRTERPAHLILEEAVSRGFKEIQKDLYPDYHFRDTSKHDSPIFLFAWDGDRQTWVVQGDAYLDSRDWEPAFLQMKGRRLVLSYCLFSGVRILEARGMGKSFQVSWTEVPIRSLPESPQILSQIQDWVLRWYRGAVKARGE